MQTPLFRQRGGFTLRSSGNKINPERVAKIVCVLSQTRLFVILWIVASPGKNNEMGPFPAPGIFQSQELSLIKSLASPASADGFFIIAPPGKPKLEGDF